MKNLLIVLALAITLLPFTSCQKEISDEITAGSGDTTGNTNKSFRPKSYTEELTTAAGDHFSDTYNLTYDASGRILSMISASNAGNRFMYKYNTNNTYSMDLYDANVLSIAGTFYLNSLQLLDSIAQQDDAGYRTSDKYLYNSAKQLITLKEYEIVAGSGATLTNRTDFEYDAAGNAIKETDNTSVTTYEFYPDLLNNVDLGAAYITKAKYLIKKTTRTGAGANSINHTYTFDSLTRLSSQKGVAANGDIFIKTFTY